MASVRAPVVTNGLSSATVRTSAPVAASTTIALVRVDPTSMPSSNGPDAGLASPITKPWTRREPWLTLVGVPICGNCGRRHASAAEVKACYARSSERGAAEVHGRKQVAGDGATEMTATFLRRTMTPSETALWVRLRSGFDGERFECQVPMFGYVPDFYCRRLRLTVEVDGRWHQGRERLDGLREDVLRANHVEVVRLPAQLVHQDVEQALEILRAHLRARASQLVRSRPEPLPPVPFVREECRHGNDALLCNRCAMVSQAVRQRRNPESGGDHRVPQRPPPGSPGRYSAAPGLVNRPPEAPGTVSRQGF